MGGWLVVIDNLRLRNYWNIHGAAAWLIFFNVFDFFLRPCVVKMIPSSTIYFQGSSSLLSDGPFIFQMREALDSSKPLFPYVFINLFRVLPIDPVSIKMHDRLYFKLQQADSRTNFLQESSAGSVISSLSSSVCLHLLLLLPHHHLPHPPAVFFCIALSSQTTGAARQHPKLSPPTPLTLLAIFHNVHSLWPHHSINLHLQLALSFLPLSVYPPLSSSASLLPFLSGVFFSVCSINKIYPLL